MTTITNPEIIACAYDSHISCIYEIVSSPIFQTIISAIESRRVVKLSYYRDREPRLFSPYLFRVTKNGDFVVIGMQNTNPNSQQDGDQRRTFRFEKIVSIELTDNVFVPVDTFTPNDKSHSTGIIECVLPWK